MLPRGSTHLAVTVLAFASPAPAQYAQQQKLSASDAAPFDQFGGAVAISGSTLVAGARQDDSPTSGTDTGAAYVFCAIGAVWSQQQKLTASDALLDDQFGTSVAIHGDTIAVGARFRDDNGTNSGAAYVFERQAGVWTEQQKLLAFDGAPFDGFGAALAISGSTLAVGAPNDASPVFEAGSVYVFVRTGATWTLQQKLVANDAGQSDGFGGSVSIDGNTLVAGSRLSEAGGNNAGSAYVFTRSGTTWTQQQKLVAFDPASGDQYGISVSVSNDTIAVGSFRDDDGAMNSGSAYVYVRSGAAWSLQQKLGANNAAQGDEFGSALSLSGDRLLVGAAQAIVGPVRRGTAYVFERRGTAWTQAQQLNSNDPLFDGGEFGSAVSLSGDRMAVGDRQDEPFGQQSGAAFVFAATEPGLASCFGIGCPCGNDDPAAGCANATGLGGRLSGAGSTSVTADDLVLRATQLSRNKLALFVAGGNAAPVPLYNGIQCAAGPLHRYTSRIQSTGLLGVVTLSAPAANSAGFVTAGSTRYFQVVYRDRPQPTCDQAGNWTNLYAVTFTP